MPSLNPELDQASPEILALASSLEGFLTPREIKLLALLAATPTAAGEVLEIGGFKLARWRVPHRELSLPAFVRQVRMNGISA